MTKSMLTRSQGDAIFEGWPVESPSLCSSNIYECSLEYEWLVDRSCPGCSASRSVPDFEGGALAIDHPTRPAVRYPSNMVGLYSVAGRDRVLLDCGQALQVSLRDRSLTVARSSGTACKECET